MKKVIVTGASGFIGRHAINTLVERGFEVHAISSKSELNISDRCTWHWINLLDSSQIQSIIKTVKPTHLLHFAWYAVPGKYWTSELNFLWVQGSLELLRQFGEQGGERVVMAGTCAEYDWNYGYCSELVTPRKPDTPYGICKQALQEMLRSYSELNHLSHAWGSIFFPYGPFEYSNRLVPSVICSLLQGKPARCSHGNQIRDFLYVQDVAEAFVALLESDVRGVVNIGSGQAIALKEIIYKIGEKIGRSDLIELGAIPPATKDPPLLVADVRRLSQEVRWKPQVSLERGIEQAIIWWKNQ